MSSVEYEGIAIGIEDIDTWFKLSKKAENDSANKHREYIIGAILNQKIPDTYYKHASWKRMRTEVYTFLDTLRSSTDPIRSLSCKHIGGRRFSYDFLIEINGNEYKVEFKFNVSSVTECPEFVSPGKPSDFLSASYEGYYYDHYLPLLCREANIPIPPRETYVRTINGNAPKCVAPLKELYKLNDTFQANAKALSKKSIEEFLKRTRLDTQRLSSYLQTSQDDKVYMMYKNGVFTLQKHASELYTIVSCETCPSKACFIATMKSGDKIKILLRWKNGNGIAFPAFQISLLKKSEGSATGLDALGITALKKLAKEKGLKGFSTYTSKTKDELVRKLKQM
jgi:hypothetical protein